MNLNPYSIGPIFSGLFILALGIYVLSKDKRKPAHLSFFFALLCISLWLSFYGVIYNLDKSIGIRENYDRFSYCAINFIPIAFFSHITIWLNLKWTNTWNLLNHAYGVIISIVILKTNLIISGTYNYYFGPYPKAGVLHPYFLLIFGTILFFCVTFLFLELKYERNQHKSMQIKYFLFGYGLLGFACLDFVPNYGLEFYPLGFIFSLLFALLLSYAIIKHRLLEIKTIVSRGIVYSILIAAVFLVYSVTVLIIERFLQNYLGYTSLSLSVIFAFTIGLIFIPLRNKIQDYIDATILKGSPIRISEENSLLRQEITQTERLKSITLFASGMAHEIKNPLTSIKTMCTYLPQKLYDKDFIEKFIPLVNKDVDRINELVHDLLDYAKPSPPDKQDTDIHKLIEGILSTLNSKIVPKKIQVHLSFDLENIQIIQIDPKQIKQAFLNILLNAIESMPPEGFLKVSTNLSSDHNQLIIQITDTGCGIAKKDLPHIFDPFFTKKEQGTGLGLSITHGIIKEHGGKIFAESEVGKGTTFRIELPIKNVN